MSDLSDLLREMLAKLATLTGVTKSKIRKLEGLLADSGTGIRGANDSIEELKRETSVLETRAKKFKSELEKTSPNNRDIVIRQIEATFADLDRNKKKQEFYFGELNRLNALKRRLEILIDNERNGIKIREDEIDEVTQLTEEMIEDIEKKDVVGRELDALDYKEALPRTKQVEDRMQEAAGEVTATSTLSPEMEKRLKELETE